MCKLFYGFYCLKFETPQTWRATVEVFDPAYKPLGTDKQKTQLYLYFVRVSWDPHVIATQPVHWRPGYCLATTFVSFVSVFGLQRVYTPVVMGRVWVVILAAEGVEV
jgi:hypothetical protein